MDAWIEFWRVVLYIGLGLFAVMSLWVIVAGLGDIKRMFAALREDGGDESES